MKYRDMDLKFFRDLVVYVGKVFRKLYNHPTKIGKVINEVREYGTYLVAGHARRPVPISTSREKRSNFVNYWDMDLKFFRDLDMYVG